MLRSGLVLLLLATVRPPFAAAATYHGHSVDGPRYDATLRNEDMGAITDVEVKFWNRHVTVFVGRRQLNLELDEEEIADPRHIGAWDDYRGIHWEIAVQNLPEKTEGDQHR